ncbi:hypothetical protein COLO4_17043 [Corchorus olitorius]|uniref:Neprosin PEP catalytic domain-containing protein n=1 Tax=Corchorus olitorius TaxID=93759 RepID=A0A1R3JEE1_9ROSI|nr:hypothetical protein COLO4_17043 [Corchorus olitorius]
MALKLPTSWLIILLIYSTFKILVVSTSISIEEDLELERQLKILNKPPITTFQTEEGDIIDCIDINKQPALDNPLLKNHKIQVKRVAVGMKEGPTFYGAYGQVSVYNISVNDQQFSSANLWVQNGPTDHPDQMNVITAGWAVSSFLNGDTRTRLFAHWWGGNSSGCFNIQCPGFVLSNPEIGVDYPFTHVSTYGSRHQYFTMLAIYRDRKTGNWWLAAFIEPTYIGYWPKEIIPKLINGANRVGWGGIAITDKDGNGPPMGSGHLPDNNYKHSCYFKRIQFGNDQDKFQTPADNATYQYADCPRCYDVLDKKGCGHYKSMHYCFTFGGPGGKCG